MKKILFLTLILILLITTNIYSKSVKINKKVPPDILPWESYRDLIIRWDTNMAN